MRRVIGARALGELRDEGALELLVSLLKDDDTTLVQTAERALVLLTRQDFGESHRKWQTWAEKNAHRHRIEWLIDGLLHENETLRAAAGDELKRITQEYYGFHPASPRKDRERVQRKYLAWWSQDGKRRFAT